MYFFSFVENPPIDKVLKKKRKKEDEKEKVQKAKLFRLDKEATSSTNTADRTKRDFELNDSSSDSTVSEDNADEKPDDIDPDESPSARFRRGCDLPSDLDMGSDYSEGSQDPVDDDDEEWVSMGSALEREFLGLEWRKYASVSMAVHQFFFFLWNEKKELVQYKDSNLLH